MISHHIHCHRPHAGTHTNLKTGAMNRNLDVLDRVAPKADRLQGWQVRFTLILVADSDVLVPDGAAQSSKRFLQAFAAFLTKLSDFHFS